MRLFLNKIVNLHGEPVSIMCDHVTKKSFHFWHSFQSLLGTKISLNTSFHPQLDRQVERTILTLEDMLQACVTDYG